MCTPQLSLVADGWQSTPSSVAMSLTWPGCFDRPLSGRLADQERHRVGGRAVLHELAEDVGEVLVERA
jgi:hypothetical protein